MDDSSVVDNIRPLTRHSNLRVRSEAIRVCLQFRDSTVERQLIYDMKQPGSKHTIISHRSGKNKAVQRMSSENCSLIWHTRPGRYRYVN
jgi:hypothetical protein